MIKFIVCDDNVEALDIAVKTVTKTMMKYETEYKVSKYKKYDEKLKKEIKEGFETKIYILDIELPKVSGLEIASEIREEDDESTIIFVTAHSECKNDIFYSRLNAIDFISKYYRYEERLEETIEHVLNKMYRNKTLDFSSNYVFTRVQFKEINYIEKAPSQNKCYIHLIDGSQKKMTAPIIGIKKKLGPMFYQTHKSCIINVDNVKKIDFANFTIYFKNGDTTMLLTPAARRELKERVGIY